MGEGSGGDGRSGLLVAGGQQIASGDLVVWLKPVAVTAAVVRRDGRVQAQGRPCDHARLGAGEAELDAACGPEAIEKVAAGVSLVGKVKGRARREMSVAFTIRAVLLMMLMPDADARAVMAALLGDLLGVPWQRQHAVPSGTVLSSWRAAVGAGPLQQLTRQWLTAAATAAATGAGAAIADREGSVGGDVGIEVGGGLRVCGSARSTGR